MRPRTLDHVALWVEDRDRIAALAVERLGMHVIERTDRFTLVGADGRRGKLTLFAAEGPRDPGALKHVAFRVPSLDGRDDELDAGEGLRIRLVEAASNVGTDFDHVALLSRDPAGTASEYLRYGFAQAAAGAGGEPRVEVGGAHVEFHEGAPGEPERPLLNHLAVLVDSADEHIGEATDLGVEIDDVVDAPNTYAVFLRGPERVRIEYTDVASRR